MIPLSSTNLQSKSWQQQLAQAITDPSELLKSLGLPLTMLKSLEAGHRLFPLKVTQDYLDNIDKEDPNDPLLRQVLPIFDECLSKEGFSKDPVGDLQATPLSGVIHKYHSRVLLITTPACAIHCRYCFRRHYPYQNASAHGKHLEKALTHIAKNTDIDEIILSGGDPLSLSDEQVISLIHKIESIKHINTLRIHTRLPIVLPDRITTTLIEALQSTSLNIVMVVHCNHPNELSKKIVRALLNMKSTGITLLNQSVLLAGVNDHPDILIKLSQQLFKAGVLPYYLHLLDKVEGASHFYVDKEKAKSFIEIMKIRLSGFLVPKLVQEIQGAQSKQNIAT